MSLDELTALLLFALLSCSFGVALFWMYTKVKLGGVRQCAREILSQAENAALLCENKSKLQAAERLKEMESASQASFESLRKKLQKKEERLQQKEEKLESRLSLIERKLLEVEHRETALRTRHKKQQEKKEELKAAEEKLKKEEETIAQLSRTDAREKILTDAGGELELEIAALAKEKLEEARESVESQCKQLLVTAIERLALKTVSEVSQVVVTLPSDEMKGRIIGRDGRNIRALERATGVNFLVDESPGSIIISGFDPMRKVIAKKALMQLVQDGRIHPTKIEEAVSKAQIATEKEQRAAGEDAAIRAGVPGLARELIDLLGKLHFRQSYGQNVLAHCLEVSHLMGLMATELGLNSQRARRIGLLHDIGKAVSHEVSGSHALIGRDLALKYGEDRYVANGIGCHHGEISPKCLEAALCGSADRISGGRPGARTEAAEEYFKRLKKMEKLAFSFPGVQQAYALQAGRELRVLVIPDMIDDKGLFQIARDLKQKIENELSYHGKVKVSVVREQQAVEYAL